VDDAFAVGDEGVEEAEDVADAAGAVARGRSPIGIGLDGFGWGGGGVGHGRIQARNENLGKNFFLHGVGFVSGVSPWSGSRCARRTMGAKCGLYRWLLLLTLRPNGGMRFAFPPYDAPRGSLEGGWY